MESQDPILERFREAMKMVYGKFDDIPTHDVCAWSPPPQPGGAGHRGRYLWTDAFGVLNFLTLFCETMDKRYLDLAKRLVQSVHDILGRTRDGRSRLAGASDTEPLKGGLRIGKVEEDGPDADGQYHHYLTLWMFALNRLSLAAEEVVYNQLAIQLAKAIHPRFIVRRHGEETMAWKISVDMSRPLVNSKGHLDDITGFAVFQILQDTARQFGQKDVSLDEEIDQYRSIMDREGRIHASSDMLDLGMSLWVSHLDRGTDWSYELSTDALSVARRVFLQEDAGPRKGMPQRLAFREFGACLGVRCYDDSFLTNSACLLLESWEKVMCKTTPKDLLAITLVMYAAALIPGVFRLDTSVADN